MPRVVKLAKALEEPTLCAALIALGGGRRPMLLVYPPLEGICAVPARREARITTE